MEPLLGFACGFAGGVVITGVVFLLYERTNKQLRKYIEFLQRQLNSAHSKMMAVDYEKLAELDIRARADAQASWYGREGWTPEFSEMDVLDPTDYKDMTDAK